MVDGPGLDKSLIRRPHDHMIGHFGGNIVAVPKSQTPHPGSAALALQLSKVKRAEVSSRNPGNTWGLPDYTPQITPGMVETRLFSSLSRLFCFFAVGCARASSIAQDMAKQVIPRRQAINTDRWSVAHGIFSATQRIGRRVLAGGTEIASGASLDVHVISLWSRRFRQ